VSDLLGHNDLNILFSDKTIKFGEDWLIWIDDSINESKVALVFLGDNGVGYYQQKEIIRLLDKDRDERGFLIIPIMLPTLKEDIYSNLPTSFINLQYLVYDDDKHQNCIAQLLHSIRSFRGSKKFNTANPYKGLKAFEKEDAQYFFGRTAEINRFFSTKCNFSDGIFPGENNFCAIIGNSGAGKSSFVNAGILAALSNVKFENSHNWIQISFNPGNNVIEALSEALYHNLSKCIDTQAFEQEILNKEDTLARKIRLTTQEPVTIFIDQFEELLINHPTGSKTKIGNRSIKNEELREKFLSNLVRLAGQKNAIVILSLRDDFASQFTFHRDFNLLLEERIFYLSTLNINKNNEQDKALLKEIIKKPAHVNGVELKDNLLNKIIDDCKYLVNALPILQLLMNNLWNRYLLDRTVDPILTIENYTDITGSKGLKGYINGHANKVYNKLVRRDKTNTKYIKQIFLNHLITLNNINTDGDLRRIATKTEVVSGDKKKEQLIEFLSADNARLIHLKKDSNGNTTVEVIHEVLIREWELLHNWIEENRKPLKQKAFYESLIGNNENQTRKGSDYHELKKWVSENNHLVSDPILRLLENSQRAKKESVKKGAKTIIVLSIVLFLLSPLINEGFKYYQITNRKDFSLNGTYLEIKSEDDYNLLYDKLYFFKHLNYISFDSLDLTSLKPIKSQKLHGFEITKLPKIDSINIYRSILKNLNIISEISSLGSLKLLNNDVMNQIEGLESLNNLKGLSISNNDALTQIKGLEKLKNLKELVISNNQALTQIGLKGLVRLTDLNISNNDGLKIIDGLNNLF